MSCTLACKVENGTRPGVFWNLVKDQEFGEYPNVTRIFLPIQCAHCAKPPCVEACPTGASNKRDDGIVLVDYAKCVGCGYCIEACPYGVRYLNKKEEGYFGIRLTPYEEKAYGRHRLGVAEKCTFCAHRVDEGKLPACVTACVGKARIFGDLDDPASQIVRMIKHRKGRQIKENVGTDPSIFYVAPFPRTVSRCEKTLKLRRR
jgi:Fe-S-cluster-containing dehydrogenase component